MRKGVCSKEPHSTMALGSDPLAKELGRICSPIQSGLRPWKSLFPSTLSCRQKAATSPFHVWIRAVNLNVGQRFPAEKQTLTMNKRIHMLCSKHPQTQWMRAGHMVVRVRYLYHNKGNSRFESTNVFFKTKTSFAQSTVNWAYFYKSSSHTGVKWGENKQAWKWRLSRKSSSNVGLLKWPKQISFWRGLTGKHAHAGLSFCSQKCVPELLMSGHVVCSSVLQDHAIPATPTETPAQCNLSSWLA